MTEYNITVGLPTVDVLHNGIAVTIRREQDPAATIRAEYAPTARACPPYCIQPMRLAAGIETLVTGESPVAGNVKEIDLDGEILKFSIIL